jgi:hypothetical protein
MPRLVQGSSRQRGIFLRNYKNFSTLRKGSAMVAIIFRIILNFFIDGAGSFRKSMRHELYIFVRKVGLDGRSVAGCGDCFSGWRTTWLNWRSLGAGGSIFFKR